MATTTIPWDDGSGDNLYFSADAFEGDQNVLVSSDANAGDQRSKTVTFSAPGVEPKSLGIIQLGSGSGSGGPIPAGYTPLRYVQTDSVAYIDTGISGNNNNLVIETLFEISTYVQYGYVFGNYVSESQNCFRFILLSASNNSMNCNNRASSGTQSTFITGEKEYIKLSRGLAVWNGMKQTLNTTDGTANNATILLGKGSSSQPKRDLGLKIYRFILTDGGTMVRDFLPAKRDSDNVGGLYDVINDTFYPSASSTPFIAGPEV